MSEQESIDRLPGASPETIKAIQAMAKLAMQERKQRAAFDRHLTRVLRRWRKKGIRPALFFGTDYNRG